MLVRALFDVAEELRFIPAALRHGSALGFFNQVATRRIDKIGIHRIKRPRRTYEVDPVVIGVDALTAQYALIDIPATLGTTRALALVHLIATEAALIVAVGSDDIANQITVTAVILNIRTSGWRLGMRRGRYRWRRKYRPHPS